jgi:predicted RNase H-like nuclease (RuvC/YqgF family)
MALEKMEALEARITSLVNLVQELKRTNTTLHGELRAARERLSKQVELSRRWKDERHDIRVRVEKVLDELDVLDSLEHRKEVALD